MTPHRYACKVGEKDKAIQRYEVDRKRVWTAAVGLRYNTDIATAFAEAWIEQCAKGILPRTEREEIS